MKFYFKPTVVEAIQFDGTHLRGLSVQEMFPDENIELLYDYSHCRYKMRVKYGRRYYEIQDTQYVMRSEFGELFVYNEDSFKKMFEELVNVEP